MKTRDVMILLRRGEVASCMGVPVLGCLLLARYGCVQFSMFCFGNFGQGIVLIKMLTFSWWVRRWIHMM